MDYNTLQICITKMLHELGMPSHINGYYYAKEGIYLIYKYPDFIYGITRKLYPQIALKFNTTSSRVERSIRHAIEISWNRGNWDYMMELFGHSIDVNKAKPTNSEYIVTLAEKLRFESKKRTII